MTAIENMGWNPMDFSKAVLIRNPKITPEDVSTEASKWVGAVEISLIAACLAPGKLNSIEKTQEQDRELLDRIA